MDIIAIYGRGEQGHMDPPKNERCIFLKVHDIIIAWYWNNYMIVPYVQSGDISFVAFGNTPGLFD